MALRFCCELTFYQRRVLIARLDSSLTFDHSILRRNHMARAVTLFTGQWADLPFETICQKAKSFGYDGVELACWGDHFEVDKALKDKGYVKQRWEVLKDHGLQCFAISAHLVGQAISDLTDERQKLIFPPEVGGMGSRRGCGSAR